MVKQEINIVWFKRDLRTLDHLPLFHAEKHELEYVSVYIFDPKKISHSDSSLRHQQFVYHSIKDINHQWKIYNRRVHIMCAPTLDVFHYLSKTYEIKNIFSFQESGIRLSWDTDKSVAEYCKKNKIANICFPKGIKKKYEEFNRIVEPDGINLDYDVDPLWAKKKLKNEL